MSKRHLSRSKAPRSWLIHRKETKWITRPNPGPHCISKCITLSLLLKNLLNYANTTREVKKILNAGKILVDGKIRKNHKFPVGLMDVISIPETNENYRVLLNKKGNFVLQPISKEEANIKPCKIISKRLLKNKKLQLNLFDGKNILVDKDTYKVGDTVLLDLSKNQIKNHIKFEKDSLIILVSGKHIGEIGVLEGVHKIEGIQVDKIIFKLKNKSFDTLRDYAFVIGKDKPTITIKND